MKLVSNFLYSIKQGVKSTFKNKTMSLLSVISVTAVLIILGIVISIVTNINEFIKVTKDEINEVRVVIDSTISVEERERVKEDILNISEVEKAEYKKKEESFNEMKKSWGEDSYLLDGIKNPLDDYFLVTVDNTEKINSIETDLKKIDGVKDIEYHQDIMENFLSVSNTVKKFGGLLIVFLLLICLVLISNTIKSKVYSKKEEIQIIKYVGGSNTFIIAPFVVEGFVIGLVGSVVAIGSCIAIYDYSIARIMDFNSQLLETTMLSMNEIAIYLVPVLLVIGLSIGILGSIISVKKYIRV